MDYKYTKETIDIFKYIQGLIKVYPTEHVTVFHFMLSTLENTECEAYRILSKLTLSSNIRSIHEWLKEKVKTNAADVDVSDDSITYDTLFDRCIEEANKRWEGDITSGQILLMIISENGEIANKFKSVGITQRQILSLLNKNNERKVTDKPTHSANSSKWRQMPKTIVDETFVDMNHLASIGKIDQVYGYDDVIDDIFVSFTKRDCNNVLLVGGSGVGKTATISHMANRLVSGDVPAAFRNKKLIKVDFSRLVSGTAYRGNLETKFNSIVTEATKHGGYIFFIDDLHTLFYGNMKIGDMSVEDMLDTFLSERGIPVISTMDLKNYKNNVEGSTPLGRRFDVITMTPPDRKKTLDIAMKAKERYEMYHNVTYTDECVREAVDIADKHMSGMMPYKALSLLDLAASKRVLALNEDERVLELRRKMLNIETLMSDLKYEGGDTFADRWAELAKERIETNSELQILLKDNILNNEKIVVDTQHVMQVAVDKGYVKDVISDKDEKARLRTLKERLTETVIGQEEAIDAVCRVVKRQRIGMGSPNKPSVLFFAGTTGTGKTYLAKRLAHEVYGSEKSLVRLDMSEYSDKMSVNKIYGSAPGYVGYEKGGVLTEAIKKNSHCVLLLDEFEKSNEDVHNVFLQMFDDGRLTDNTGNVVDFSNVTVIMTSNVGAKEIGERGNGIGFIHSDNTRQTIESVMKKTFKPEFINRIDSIVFFNKLSEDNLKEIIRIEIGKIGERINSIGYVLGDSFLSGSFVDSVYADITDGGDYGARPVLRALQRRVEDPITDYIIENDIENGFVFEVDIL